MNHVKRCEKSIAKGKAKEWVNEETSQALTRLTGTLS